MSYELLSSAHTDSPGHAFVCCCASWRSTPPSTQLNNLAPVPQPAAWYPRASMVPWMFSFIRANTLRTSDRGNARAHLDKRARYASLVSVPSGAHLSKRSSINDHRA